MKELPFIVALCPTYRRPECLANSLWLWGQQTYPADRCSLIMFDDGGSFHNQNNGQWDISVPGWQWKDSWKLVASSWRLPSITDKYNHLAFLAPQETDAFLIWEDDDIYLPGYVEAHAKVLAEHEYSKAAQVMSDYPGYLIIEEAAGRFFSSIGFQIGTAQLRNPLTP